jgi:hypothetical protein
MPKTFAEVRHEFDQEVISVILNRPELRYADIGELFGISYWAVNAIVKKHGLTGKLGRRSGPKPKKRTVANQG